MVDIQLKQTIMALEMKAYLEAQNPDPMQMATFLTNYRCWVDTRLSDPQGIYWDQMVQTARSYGYMAMDLHEQ